MENNGIWTETFRMDAFMVNRNREATFTTVGNLFQEVAGNHAFCRQVDFYSMQEKGLYWVLNKMKIQMHKFPTWREKVVVNTWVSEMQPFSHRHFELQNLAGEMLGSGISLWIPIDATTNRPRRLKDYDIQLVDKKTALGMPQKLPEMPQNAQNTEGVALPNEAELKQIFASERLVEYSDLDMLGHVNNVKYTEWMLDNFHRKNDIFEYKTLEINYLDEVKLGEIIKIEPYFFEGNLNYSLKRNSDNKEVCRARFSM